MSLSDYNSTFTHDGASISPTSFPQQLKISCVAVTWLVPVLQQLDLGILRSQLPLAILEHKFSFADQYAKFGMLGEGGADGMREQLEAMGGDKSGAEAGATGLKGKLTVLAAGAVHACVCLCLWCLCANSSGPVGTIRGDFTIDVGSNICMDPIREIGPFLAHILSIQFFV